MRALALLALVAAALGGLLFSWRGTASVGDGAQPLPIPAPAGSSTARQPAGPAAEGAARASVDPDEAFSASMRGRYADQSTQALGARFLALRQEVAVQAMKLGQPRVLEPDAPLDGGQEFAPDVLVYRGPDAERRMRVVELSREEFPELCLKHREVVWLQAEIARRQTEARR